jgi:putative membrane protein
MKIFPLVRTEFARLFSSRLGIASLIALMTVPIIYGGLYLWGNHDPYNNLGSTPAAIVVADKGATLDGTTVNYGSKAAKTLVDGKKFGWRLVSAKTAAAGVSTGKYDFIVTFPADFSKDLISAGTKSPSKATLTLTTDDTNGYLSTTLAKQATTAVQASITQQVAQAGSLTLLDGVAQLRGGLVDAQAGSSKLESGASRLSSGLAKINANTKALPGKTAALNTGAQQVASGLSTLTKGEAKYRASLVQALALFPAAEQKALLGGFDQLVAGTRSAHSGASQVAAGTSQLASQTPALASGISKSASGASSLQSGTQKLNSSLLSGIAKTPATTTAERHASAKALGAPLVVKQDAITEAATYGAGLAPFFISLAAWIGIYALFLIVRPVSRRALTAVRRPIRTTLAGWITPGILGVVQMLALFAILTLALQLPIANALGLVAFMAFLSITFAAIVLALNVLLGSVGQFLGLVLMIIQIVVAGGTFPWQTLPAPLAALHTVLPMGFGVTAIRQLMYGGTSGAFWSAVWPLAIWLVVALVATVFGVNRQSRFRSLTQLRPSAIGG